MRPAPTVLPLFVGGCLSPVARLAGAVVARALNDARLGDEAAVRWLADTSSGLGFWAAILNAEPEELAERARPGRCDADAPRGRFCGQGMSKLAVTPLTSTV